MPWAKKYTDDERALGLTALAAHKGNVEAASEATGIGYGALRHWKQLQNEGKIKPRVLFKSEDQKAVLANVLGRKIQMTLDALTQEKLEQSSAADLAKVLKTLGEYHTGLIQEEDTKEQKAKAEILDRLFAVAAKRSTLQLEDPMKDKTIEIEEDDG